MADVDKTLFRDLTLEKAQVLATEDKKSFLLIDFYTDWCGPCKKLDETTWKDPEVRAWLLKEAISLKIDAEKNEDLATKYRVNVYPTILLLKPDGTEIDRLVGYRDPKTFRADAQESLAGNDTLTRARKNLEGANANDPMLRMSYGDALAQKARNDDALSEYLWCFDHGLEHGPGFTGVRLSFLLSKIVQLGQVNPSAIQELRKRRDDAARALEAGKANFSSTMGFASLNSYLGEPEQTLAMYDRTKEKVGLPVGVVAFLRDQAVDLLLQAKRYKELVAEVEAEPKIREAIANHRRMLPFMPNDASLRSMMKRQVATNGAKYYEAHAGAGDLTGAARIAAILTEFDPADAYPALIAAAGRAGHPELVEKLTEESRKSTSSEPADPTKK